MKIKPSAHQLRHQMVRSRTKMENLWIRGARIPAREIRENLILQAFLMGQENPTIANPFEDWTDELGPELAHEFNSGQKRSRKAYATAV